ncbi:response regulator [Cryobacterium sp. TMT1-62]|uniref:Transcriptional regulatory protein n=1 Tax=Cryobacterium sandaracinum TaxID=1259247 RepID=A0ABY2JIQ4_9MICO|nr:MULTISPECIES: response regulator [Cryobacterium]TFB53347.1 response regulator [Cryobacterium sp. Sr3]TFC51435.1 response regulator [Cryobacterium sp. TMT2-17-1]TFC71640.1 response regulator [Cryobacterium sp. TMT2-4]TFD06822.1 response regulator [Cryobacterium sandaracinum]TFD36793.1 response regulator [Cryobacterium sp. TMT1-62]
MTDRDIRVLVVEDEAIAAEAHAAYLGRLTGFVHAGTVGDGHSALRALATAVTAGQPIDLVLMDMTLPDLHGLDVSRRMRAAGLTTDIIAITAVRELHIVRGAVAAGIVQYLIKPFTYSTFAQKLVQYRDFRLQLGGLSAMTSQTDVDLAFASLRTPTELPRPKGLSEGTLGAVIEFLKLQTVPVSSSEVMEQLGISRVTARRYLEHLADTGSLERSPRYGTPGRPENEYVWKRL